MLLVFTVGMLWRLRAGGFMPPQSVGAPLRGQTQPRQRVSIPIPQYPPVAAGDDLETVLRKRLEIVPPLEWEVQVGVPPHEHLLESQMSEVHFLNGLPADQGLDLASLAPQFGNDPRYWLLCYRYNCTSLVPASEVKRLHAAGFPACTWYLEEARRRGIADAPLLLELYKVYFVGDYNAEQQPPILGAQDEEELNIHVRKLSAFIIPETLEKFLRDHGAQLGELVKEMQAKAPDEALPYYMEAALAALKQDVPAAQAAVQQGNRAAKCDPLEGFPLAGLTEEMLNGNPVNPFVSGRLAKLAGQSYTDPDVSGVQDVVRLLLGEAKRRRDLGLLGELHRFVCRSGQAGELYDLMSSSEIIMGVVDAPGQLGLLSDYDGSQPSGYQYFHVHMQNSFWPGNRMEVGSHRSAASGSVNSLPATQWQWLGEKQGDQPQYFKDHILNGLKQRTEYEADKAATRQLWQESENIFDYQTGKLLVSVDAMGGIQPSQPGP